MELHFDTTHEAEAEARRRIARGDGHTYWLIRTVTLTDECPTPDRSKIAKVERKSK